MDGEKIKMQENSMKWVEICYLMKSTSKKKEKNIKKQDMFTILNDNEQKYTDGRDFQVMNIKNILWRQITKRITNNKLVVLFCFK